MLIIHAATPLMGQRYIFLFATILRVLSRRRRRPTD